MYDNCMHKLIIASKEIMSVTEPILLNNWLSDKFAEKFDELIFH